MVITYTVSFCQGYSYKTLIFEVCTTQLQLNINTYEMILQWIMSCVSFIYGVHYSAKTITKCPTVVQPCLKQRSCWEYTELEGTWNDQ